MRLLNDALGYGLVTKTLHWVTVAAIAGQFAVGYTMDADGDVEEEGCEPPDEHRSGGATTDAEEDRLDRIEDRCEAQQDNREEAAEDGVGTAFSHLGSGDLLVDGLSLPEVHLLLGLSIMALGLVRVLWRATTPLPPWAEALSAGERRLESRLEKALILLLFLVPVSGLLLVLGDTDWLPVHIAAHVLFFSTLTLHVALVLRHTVVRRDRHLQRML